MRLKTSFNVRVESSDHHSTAPAAVAGEHEKLFEPAADRYRRRLSKAVASGVAGFVLSGLSLLVPESFLKPIAIPGVFCIGLSLALFFTLPALLLHAVGV